MKKLFFTLSFFMALFLSIAHNCYAGENGTPGYFSTPSVPAKNMAFAGIDGDRAAISWTNGNGSRRLVIASKDSVVTAAPVNGVSYNANYVFGAGPELKPGQFVVFDGTNYTFDLTGLTPSHTYYLSVFEYNGSSFTTEYLIANPATGFFATKSAPTQQAFDLSASAITGNSMLLSWNKGNGDRRLVVARKGSPVNANPADIIHYNSNFNYGDGAQVGSGNFVVYDGQGTTETIKNLDPGATYYYSVFEYNGSWAPVYLTASPAMGSFTTAARPSVAASNVVLVGSEGNTMTLTFNGGNGARHLVVARAGSPVTAVPVDGTEYNYSSAFGGGDALSAGQFVILNGTNNTVDISNLQPNTVYHFAVFEFDGNGSNTRYLTTAFATSSRGTISSPSIQASTISFSNITHGTATINFTAGNGSRRLIIAREGSPVTSHPANLIPYSVSDVFGTYLIGAAGNFGIAYTSSTSADINGLQPGKTYYISVFELNGSSGPVYNTTAPATGSFTTLVTPTVASTNISYSGIEGNSVNFLWTVGNGTKRLIIARAGSPVTAMPVDGVNYTADNNFGNGTEISPGEFVVFSSAGDRFDLKNLAANTTYYVAVFEYSVGSTSPYYLRTQYLTGTKATLAAPTVAASNFTSTVTSNYIRVDFTAGNGQRRLIVTNPNGPVNVSLSNFINYNGATLPGGNTVVANTSETTFALYGLAPNTTMYFAVIEMNGLFGPVYMQSGQLNGVVTTAPRPTTEPYNGYFTRIEGNSLGFQWSNGNGTKRLIIGRKGSPVTTMPVDGIEYIANDTLGRGFEMAPGEFVVGATTNFYSVVKGLDTASTYYFTVFEYDGTGTNTGYLTAKKLMLSATTAKAPTVQTSNVIFSNITATTANIGWTNGDGANRLVILKKGSPVAVQPENFISYVYSASFGYSPIGDESHVVYKDNASSSQIYGLEPGTTYYVSVYEYNGYSGPVYLKGNPAVSTVTTLGPPAVQASALQFSNHNLTDVNLKWVNGSGQKRVVVAHKGTAVAFSPADRTTYTANSFFESGQLVGNSSYVVYNGTGDNVTITNLNRDEIYHFTIFEYNQFPTGEFYKATGAPAVILLAKPYIYDTTALLGLNATFTVSSTQVPTAYQWQVNTGNGFVNLTNSGLYAGSQSQTLQITGALANMHGYRYQCLVTSAMGTVSSNTARLTIFGSTLPVRFVSVKAAQKANSVQVDWQTAAEVNMATYEIERSSTDGNFQKIGSVAAKGGITNEYSWLDAASLPGTNRYRIKAIERTGGIAYSNVVMVKMDSKADPEIVLYPNPLPDQTLHVQFTNLGKGIYTIRLLNNSGQLILSEVQTYSGGSATQTIQLKSNLPSGIYHLQVVGKDTILTKRFIKQ